MTWIPSTCTCLTRNKRKRMCVAPQAGMSSSFIWLLRVCFLLMNFLQLCFFSPCIHFQKNKNKKCRGCYHASWSLSCQSKYQWNYLTHEREFVHSFNLKTETTPYDLSDQSQLINTTRKTNIRHCINTENCSQAVSALLLHNKYLRSVCTLIISIRKKKV